MPFIDIPIRQNGPPATDASWFNTLRQEGIDLQRAVQGLSAGSGLVIGDTTASLTIPTGTTKIRLTDLASSEFIEVELSSILGTGMTTAFNLSDYALRLANNTTFEIYEVADETNNLMLDLSSLGGTGMGVSAADQAKLNGITLSSGRTYSLDQWNNSHIADHLASGESTAGWHEVTVSRADITGHLGIGTPPRFPHNRVQIGNFDGDFVALVADVFASNYSLVPGTDDADKCAGLLQGSGHIKIFVRVTGQSASSSRDRINTDVCGAPGNGYGNYYSWLSMDRFIFPNAPLANSGWARQRITSRGVVGTWNSNNPTVDTAPTGSMTETEVNNNYETVAVPTWINSEEVARFFFASNYAITDEITGINKQIANLVTRERETENRLVGKEDKILRGTADPRGVNTALSAPFFTSSDGEMVLSTISSLMSLSSTSRVVTNQRVNIHATRAGRSIDVIIECRTGNTASFYSESDVIEEYPLSFVVPIGGVDYTFTRLVPRTSTNRYIDNDGNATSIHSADYTVSPETVTPGTLGNIIINNDPSALDPINFFPVLANTTPAVVAKRDQLYLHEEVNGDPIALFINKGSDTVPDWKLFIQIKQLEGVGNPNGEMPTPVAIKAPHGFRYRRLNADGTPIAVDYNRGTFDSPEWVQELDLSVTRALPGELTALTTEARENHASQNLRLEAIERGDVKDPNDQDSNGIDEEAIKRAHLEQGVQDDLADAGGVREDLDIYYIFNPNTQNNPYSHRAHFGKPAGNILGYIGNYASVGSRDLARHHGGTLTFDIPTGVGTQTEERQGVIIIHEYDHGDVDALAIQVAIDIGDLPLISNNFLSSIHLTPIGDLAQTFSRSGFDANSNLRMQQYGAEGVNVGSPSRAVVFNFRSDRNFLSRTEVLQGFSAISFTGTGSRADHFSTEGTTPHLVASQGVRARISNHIGLQYERTYRVDPTNTNANRWAVEDNVQDYSDTPPLILERIPIAHTTDPDADNPVVSNPMRESPNISDFTFYYMLRGQGVATSVSFGGVSGDPRLPGSTDPALTLNQDVTIGFRMVDTNNNDDAVVRAAIVFRRSPSATIRAVLFMEGAVSSDDLPEGFDMGMAGEDTHFPFRFSVVLDPVQGDLGGGTTALTAFSFDHITSVGRFVVSPGSEVTLTPVGNTNRYQMQVFSDPLPALAGLPNQLADVIGPKVSDPDEDEIKSGWYYNALTSLWNQITDYEELRETTLITSEPPTELGGSAAFGFSSVPSGASEQALYSRAGLSVGQGFRQEGESDVYEINDLGDNLLQIRTSRGFTRSGVVVLVNAGETNQHPIFVLGTHSLEEFPRSYAVVTAEFTYIYERSTRHDADLLNSSDVVIGAEGANTVCFYQRRVGGEIPSDARITNFFIIRPAESGTALQFVFNRPTVAPLAGRENQLTIETNEFDRRIVENIYRGLGDGAYERMQLQTPEIRSILSLLGINIGPLGLTNSFNSGLGSEPTGVSERYWLDENGGVHTINQTNQVLSFTYNSGEELQGLDDNLWNGVRYIASIERPNLSGTGRNFAVIISAISAAGAVLAQARSTNFTFDLTSAERRNRVNPIPGLAILDNGAGGRDIVAMATSEEGNNREYILWSWTLNSNRTIENKLNGTTRTMITVGNVGNIEAIDIKLFRNRSMLADADPIEHLFAIIIDRSHYILRAYPLTSAAGVRSLDRNTHFDIATLDWPGSVRQGAVRGLNIIPSASDSSIDGINVCIGRETHTFGGTGLLQTVDQLKNKQVIQIAKVEYSDSALSNSTLTSWANNTVSFLADAPIIDDWLDSDILEFTFYGSQGRIINYPVSVRDIKRNGFREAVVDTTTGPIQRVDPLEIHRPQVTPLDNAGRFAQTTVYLTRPPGTNNVIELWGAHMSELTAGHADTTEHPDNQAQGRLLIELVR